MFSGHRRRVAGQILAEAADFGSYRRRVGHRQSVCGRDNRVLKRGGGRSGLPQLVNLVVGFPVDVLEARLRGINLVGRGVQRFVVCVVKISLRVVQGSVGHVAAPGGIRESARTDLHEIVCHSA
jgi:hypothetical protein